MRSTQIINPQSLMDSYRSFPEGTRVELIDNRLYFMSSSPGVNHQRALADLYTAIRAHVLATSVGEVFFAPVDVYLDEVYNAVQPDLLFIAKEHAHIVHDDGIHGSPDLIIEVLSPGNVKHDTVRKRELYQRFKVQEYWIVDPVEKTASGYTLVNDQYELIGIFKNNISSVVLGKMFPF